MKLIRSKNWHITCYASEATQVLWRCEPGTCRNLRAKYFLSSYQNLCRNWVKEYWITTFTLTKTNLSLRNGALESTTDTRIQTFRTSPWRSPNAKKLLVLMSFEGLGPLLDNLMLDERRDLGHSSCPRLDSTQPMDGDALRPPVAVSRLTSSVRSRSSLSRVFVN